jgi:hypothetical protein
MRRHAVIGHADHFATIIATELREYESIMSSATRRRLRATKLARAIGLYALAARYTARSRHARPFHFARTRFDALLRLPAVRLMSSSCYYYAQRPSITPPFARQSGLYLKFITKLPRAVAVGALAAILTLAD